MTKEEKIDNVVRGHCPECGPNRFADVVGHHCQNWDDGEGMWGQVDYRILKCRGCGSLYFQRDEIFSENSEVFRDPVTGDWDEHIPHSITHWPSPAKRDQPNWTVKLDLFDSHLGSLFADIYGALNADLRVPAAISVRTTFDRASEMLGIDPAVTFDEKLDELLSQGKIGKDERDSLDVLTDAGSAAAHRGWRPSLKQLETMIEILESFLHRAFILGDAAKKLKASVPAKPKRKPKAKKPKT